MTSLFSSVFSLAIENHPGLSAYALEKHLELEGLTCVGSNPGSATDRLLDLVCLLVLSAEWEQ